ncbi:hypothetical protein D9757_006753 [Collybiopsis confluens]|uniref:Uncharacterized protein n=1 Tax=Collybiopsis confluens TaxID=2823264 RepID=A0A8H5HM82_9AGAR|nr:hypothetical protein D9757_006753 [Collybiopsis confluens]
MSATLMSRLMLHLHQFADQGLYVPHTKTLALSSSGGGGSGTFASTSGTDWITEGAEQADEGRHGVALTTFWTNTFDHAGTGGTAGAITASTSSTVLTGHHDGTTSQSGPRPSDTLDHSHSRNGLVQAHGYNVQYSSLLTIEQE